LRSHNPPFAKITIAIRVTFLHRILQDLAWNHQIPALAHLLSRADVPRRDEISPRPLLPEQDQLIQKELQSRDDFFSNLLMLQRHADRRVRGSGIGLPVPTWSGSVGHPRTARQTQDRTLGSSGLYRLPNRGTPAGLTRAHCGVGPFSVTSQSCP